MAIFPRPSSPRAAWADLRAFMRDRDRDQLVGAALAVLSTLIIVIVFLVDAKINTAPPATIIYVDSWRADRSDAEIVAQQKRDQAAAEEAARARQREYQKLEKMFGI